MYSLPSAIFRGGRGARLGKYPGVAQYLSEVNFKNVMMIKKKFK